MDQSRYQNLLPLLWSFLRKLNRLQAAPRDYGLGELLSAAEIHTLEAIGKHPGSNVSDLARLMEVTKGAMSQTLDRLAGKGLLARRRREGNGKEVLPELSARGWQAFAGHEAYHARFDSGLAAELEELSPTEYAFLERILRRLNQGADLYLAALEAEPGGPEKGGPGDPTG